MKSNGKRAMHDRNRYLKLITGLAAVLIGTLCLGRTGAKADDFSDMLGEQPDGTYGVIEYFPTEGSPSMDSDLTDIVQDVPPIPESADSTAGETIAALLIVFVLPVLLIVAVIVIVVKIKKKSKKNGAEKE